MRRASPHWARMTATGVRSSCDASEVNCFSASNEVSSRANMLSNACPSRLISSRPDGRPMRRDRSRPSLISPTVRIMRSIGRNVDRAIR